MGQVLAKKLTSKLSLGDLRTPLLKKVYQKDFKEVRLEVHHLNNTLDEKQFHYELTLAFWLSVHMEHLEIANYLIKKEPMLRKIVAATFKKK